MLPPFPSQCKHSCYQRFIIAMVINSCIVYYPWSDCTGSDTNMDSVLHWHLSMVVGLIPEMCTHRN